MILSRLPDSEQLLLYSAAVFGLFIVLVALGRVLKRWLGVHLGWAYRLLCLALAAEMPLEFLVPHDQLSALRDPLRAGSIILSSFLIMALIRRFVWEWYFEKSRKIVIPKLLRDIVAILLVALAVVGALTYLGKGQALTGLLAGSGIAAVVLGFAMQDTLANIISGISMQISQTFKEGQWLRIDNQYAEIMEINWRSTRLRTNDYIFLDIPNSFIIKNTVVNLNYQTPEYAMHLRVGIDYDVPPNLVKEALEQAANGVPGVLASPAPRVTLADFGDSSITYDIKFWMNNHALYNEISSAIRTNIWYNLKRRNIKIPFPIRTVQMERAAKHSHVISERQRNRLRKQSFFQCLDENQVDKLLNSAPVCHFGRGEEMVRQGAQGDSMFVILHGSAAVYVGQNGASTKVATLADGEFFGEMSLLTGEPRTATVKAEADCEVLKIDNELLGDIVQHGPGLLERLGEMLAQRKLETDGVVATMASRKEVQATKEQYTAGFLAKLSKIFEL